MSGEAAKDKADRDRQLDPVRAELERIATLRAKATTPANTSGKAAKGATDDTAAHVKAECALRDHKALGRWVKQTPSGRLIIDTAKVTAEDRLDGK